MSEETSVVRRIGRYHVVDELGRGGMGIVYKGFDPVIGRTVALKTLGIAGQDAEGKQLRERLYREASAAGTLTHAGIVTIYDIIEDGDTTAVAMEFVEGRTLADLLAERGPLPLDRALELFEQIALALDYAGAKGIVHRDIKPANVLLTPDGHAKITDFGIARMAVSTLTQTGTIMGSPSYMSPEQVRGVPLDPRSDLFSAAVVLYEMLTGERPFGGDDVATTMYRIVNEPPKALDLVNVSIHPAVSAVLQRALAKNPADRFQSGAEAVAELKRSLGVPSGGLQTSAMAAMPSMPSMSLPLPPPAPLPAKSKLPLIAGAAGAFVILALVVLYAIGKRGSAPGAGGDAGTVQGVQVSAGQQATQQAPGVDIPAPETPPSGGGMELSGPVSTIPPPPPGLALAAAGATEAEAAKPPESEAAEGAGRRRDGAAAPVKPATKAAKPASPAADPVRAEEKPATPLPASPATTREEPSVSRPVAKPAEPPAAPVSQPPAPATGDAMLRLDFEGEPYQVTIFAGDERLGVISQPGTMTIDAGTVKVRAVSEAVFLNADLGTVALRPGDRKAVALPGLASAVFNVKGEDYAGVRILIDGRQVPGPYPAQLAKVAAGTHTVVYKWVSGPAAGREISKTVTFTARGHFLVRAVVDNAEILVQQLR